MTTATAGGGLGRRARVSPAGWRTAGQGFDRHLRKLTMSLGSDLSVRLYPNTGPTIRDRHQARILEALARAAAHLVGAHFLRSRSRHPSRGWIDAVLHDATAGTIVATEIQSDLRRLEQLLRWFPEKVASLPSWEGWAHLGAVATTSQLLIVRSTKATRQVGREFERQLAAAYPAHPADAIAALTGTAPWPGAALVWAEIERDRVRFIAKAMSRSRTTCRARRASGRGSGRGWRRSRPRCGTRRGSGRAGASRRCRC